MQSDATNWFKEAFNEFEIAKILFDNEKWNMVVFHSQKSAEKGIKALMYAEDYTPWGHSSSSLLKEYYSELGLEINQELIDCCSELDSHYLTTRYPNDSLNVPPSEL